MSEANDDAIADEVEDASTGDDGDVASQRTLLFWRRPVTRLVLPEEERVIVPESPTRRMRNVAAVGALVGLLIIFVSYGIGYTSGHRLGARTSTTPTPASVWRVVWQHSGHGGEFLTPPPLTAHDTPRVLYAWTCDASPTQPTGSTSLMVTLVQDGVNIPVASVSCPGYGNAAITVGSGSGSTTTLHTGRYSVVIQASGGAAWTLAIEEGTTAKT